MKFTALLFLIFSGILSCNSEESNIEQEAENSATSKIVENKKKSIETPAEPKDPIPTKYHGSYSAYVETELTSTGMASMTYYFVINDDSINLDMNTYHEPLRCIGNYRSIVKNDMLHLYYLGDDEYCRTENANFLFKSENNKLFAKGLGGDATAYDWIELN